MPGSHSGAEPGTGLIYTIHLSALIIGVQRPIDLPLSQFYAFRRRNNRAGRWDVGRIALDSAAASSCSPPRYINIGRYIARSLDVSYTLHQRQTPTGEIVLDHTLTIFNATFEIGLSPEIRRCTQPDSGSIRVTDTFFVLFHCIMWME